MARVALGILAAAAAVNVDAQYTPDWASLDARPLPQWFDEAKFGIFIHWGLFSVPAYKNEWYWWSLDGSKDQDYVDYHKRMYGLDAKYQDFAPQFQAKLFDPARWAKMFKRAGARYVVLTSKHHEGYTLWPSNVSWNWNAMDVGPHRDLVGELAEAVRAENITYGLYHSLFEWFNPLYLQDKANNFTTRRFVEEKTMVELREIVDRYKPDLIWSDGDWEAPVEYWGTLDFLAWLYNDSPVKDTVVTNDRWGQGCSLKHGGYFSGADRQQPGPELLAHKWENAMTVQSSTWGYSKFEDLSGYLTSADVVNELISTVAYGGNMLLNVGPTEDGLILPIFEKILAEVGDYLEINGEAIYGSKAAKVQNATVGDVLAYFTAGAKQDYYLTVGLPDLTKPVVVPQSGIATAELLVKGGVKSVKCTASDEGSSCQLPLEILQGDQVDRKGLVLRLTPTVGEVVV